MIINPSWALRAIDCLQNTTPETLHALVYGPDALELNIQFDKNTTLSLLHNGGLPRDEQDMVTCFISQSTLQAACFRLWNVLPALSNLAYLNGLWVCYGGPKGDIFNVLVDHGNSHKTANALRQAVTAYAKDWFARSETPTGLTEIIAEANPADIYGWLAVCSCWVALTDRVWEYRLPEVIAELLTGKLNYLADEASRIVDDGLRELLNSVKNSVNKKGKGADKAGFIAVVRSLEAAGAKITKISKGRKVFDEEKIFKVLKPYTRDNPYQFDDYDVFIEQTPDPQGYMDPSIFQISPDLKERRLTMDSFRKHILSKMTPF